MLPYSSPRKPSQYPRSILWKMSPPDKVAPSGPTLKTRMYWGGDGSVGFRFQLCRVEFRRAKRQAH
jgi:hypothetical protein